MEGLSDSTSVVLLVAYCLFIHWVKLLKYYCSYLYVMLVDKNGVKDAWSGTTDCKRSL